MRYLVLFGWLGAVAPRSLMVPALVAVFGRANR